MDQMSADRRAGRVPEDRDSILSRMGYSSYDAYRNSPLWRKIRKRILQRDGKLCIRCGDPATEVHHRNYMEPVLCGDDDVSLVSLCRGCHETVERDKEGRWRSETEKHEVLYEEHVRRDREANRAAARLRFAEQVRKYCEYAAQKNYQCDWCGGHARTQSSIERIWCLPGEGDAGQVLLCFGCYETIKVDGRGRQRTPEVQRALLSCPANCAYTRPDVGVSGHANRPQNWQRLNVRQRESWEAERNYRAALLKEPQLATSDPIAHEILKNAYDQASPHGKEKRPQRFSPLRGPDPIPGTLRKSGS
jgi:hypothetical protein